MLWVAPLRIIEITPFVWQMRDESQEEELTRGDFLGVFNEMDNLIPTQDLAEHVGCSEEVAREWLFKLEDEGELTTMPEGNKGIVWVKKS